jgi:hypothetical protein
MCVVVMLARDRKKNTVLRVKRVIILTRQRDREMQFMSKRKKNDLKEQSGEVYHQFYLLKDHLKFSNLSE